MLQKNEKQSEKNLSSTVLEESKQVQTAEKIGDLPQVSIAAGTLTFMHKFLCSLTYQLKILFQRLSSYNT